MSDLFTSFLNFNSLLSRFRAILSSFNLFKRLCCFRRSLCNRSFSVLKLLAMLSFCLQSILSTFVNELSCLLFFSLISSILCNQFGFFITVISLPLYDFKNQLKSKPNYLQITSNLSPIK